MRSWKQCGTGDKLRYTSYLEQHELEILQSVVSSTYELLDERSSSAIQDELAALTGITTGHSAAPEEATLARLLPNFFREDLSAELVGNAADFNAGLRSVHEPAILDSKIAAALGLLGSLPLEEGQVSLSADQAELWLRALNDVRLALGVMLEISEEASEEQRFTKDDESETLSMEQSVYNWLTWIQDNLLSVMFND